MLIRTVVCGVCKELNAARMNSCKHCRVTKMYPSLAIAPLLFFTHLRAALSSGTPCSGNFCGANEYCDYNVSPSQCAAKKTINAFCSYSSQCASGYCESIPTINGCSSSKCWECNTETTCNAQTRCKYDTAMSYCTQTSSEGARPR